MDSKREYVDSVKLPADVDWDLWEFVDGLLAERIPDKANNFPEPYMARLSDGKLLSRTFTDFRAQAEHEDVRDVHVARHRDGLLLTMSWDPFFGGEVRAQGPDQEQVLGFIARVKRELAKPRPPPVASSPPARWYARVLQAPNPWVLSIVGGALAALIVYLVTT